MKIADTISGLGMVAFVSQDKTWLQYIRNDGEVISIDFTEDDSVRWKKNTHGA